MPSVQDGRSDFISIAVADSTRIHTQLLAEAIKADRGLHVVASAPRSEELLSAVSRVPIDKVEVIQNGNVIARREIAPQTSPIQVREEVEVPQSSWFAVRVTGPPARGVVAPGGIPRAHSGVIYVNLGGRPTVVKDDVELMLAWVDRLWLLLEERRNLGPGENRERARQMIQQARRYYERKLSEAR